MMHVRGGKFDIVALKLVKKNESMEREMAHDDGSADKTASLTV